MLHTLDITPEPHEANALRCSTQATHPAAAQGSAALLAQAWDSTKHSKASDGRRPQPTTAVEQKTVTEGALNAYAIGEGFEGSASDWTEYVVWSVGVAALIFYLSGTVEINVYNIDE